MSITAFRRAIALLKSDPPADYPGKRYRTQKQHWLGWLGEYHGPGAYDRRTGVRRNAEYAYNHVVESKMLLWLVRAAGLPEDVVRRAESAERRAGSMQAKSAAVRRHAPWPAVEERLRRRPDRATAS